MGRRGPRKQKGKREVNGRPSRKRVDVMERLNALAGQAERDAMETALEARVRVYRIDQEFIDRVPVTEGDAPPTAAMLSRDQMTGSVVGRLCLTGQISRIQYDAAQAWLECRDAYLRAVSPAIGKQPGALNPNATHGQSNYENVAQSRLAVARYTAACSAVQEKQNELHLHSHLTGALDVILVRDVQIENLVGDLRTALNALAKHFKLEGRKAA